jgi:hypothetical protein
MVTPAAVIAVGVGQPLWGTRGGPGTPDRVEARTHAKASLSNIDQT